MYAMHKKKKESNRNSPMNCWTVFLVVKAAYTISEAVWYSGMFVGFGCFLLMGSLLMTSPLISTHPRAYIWRT